jgi:hypothetical protein
MDRRRTPNLFFQVFFLRAYVSHLFLVHSIVARIKSILPAGVLSDPFHYDGVSSKV